MKTQTRKFVDKMDHAMDAMRYVLMVHPKRTKYPMEWKFFFKVMLLTFVLVTLLQVVMKLGLFFESHTVKFHSPVFFEKIEVISPIPDTTPTPKPTQTPTPEPTSSPVKVNSYDLKAVVSFVHFRESNNGTAPQGYHVRCREKGMTNEYGYGPSIGICFNTPEEAQGKIYNWFENNVAQYGLAPALCRYNTGAPLSDCKYYHDYLAYTLK